MPVRRDKKSKIQPNWIIDINAPGFRKRTRFRGTYEEALQREQMLLRRGQSDSYGYITLSELHDQHIKFLDKRGRSQGTIDRYKVAFVPLLSFFGNSIQASSIQPLDIESYIDDRMDAITPRKKKIKRVTVNADLRHIRATFNWAVKKEILLKTPLRGVENLATEEKEVRFLEENELHAIQDIQPNYPDKDAIDLYMFYLTTGARCSEILPPSLTWDKINWEKPSMEIKIKGNRHRTVLLDSTMIHILKSRFERGEQVPFNFTRHNVYTKIMNIYLAAGVENAGVHTLRKTCGAIMIQAGADIYRVRDWLGHKLVSTTERYYAGLLDTGKKELADNVHLAVSKYFDLNSVHEPLVPYLCQVVPIFEEVVYTYVSSA